MGDWEVARCAATRKLFPDDLNRLDLELTEATPYGSGIVFLHYRPRRPPSD